MAPMLNIAIRAARKAGDLISRHMMDLHRLEVMTKGANDFVTRVDEMAEEAIIETIHAAYPDHSILAEESGAQGDSPYQWIIDPLDGTTNYLHGHPQFAVSIAVKHQSQLEHAVVYDPMRQELFTASRGSGTQLNNRRVRVSKLNRLDGALLGTGFPIRRPDQLDKYLETFKAVFPRASGIRRAGAASLDLAWVAAGRLDGFWEMHLQPWDIAAGALLIQEAGGLVGDMQGGSQHLEKGSVVAANPKLFKELLKAVAIR